MNRTILVEQYVSFLVVRDLQVTVAAPGANMIIDEREDTRGDVWLFLKLQRYLYLIFIKSNSDVPTRI